MKKKAVSLLLALGFILGSWKGYLALFADGAREPCQIFPIATDSLPPADRQALEDGMVIRSRARLRELLEQYLS